MEQLLNILARGLEALSDHNVSPPTEIEMLQGLQPSEWWLHTDVGYYVNVYPLRSLPGLWASVHEYIEEGHD
jgi:hypothetical protein